MNTYGHNLIKPCSSRTCSSPSRDLPLPLPNPYSQSPYNQFQHLTPTDKPSFWELLSPALLGTAGALVLSLFAGCNHSLQSRGGKVFKLSIVFYAIGTTVAATGALFKSLTDSKPPHKKLHYPVSTVLVSVVVFFAAEYLLLYRFSPDSFTGDIGDSLGMQFLSFVYFSITSLATGNLGDIMPKDLAARALISTEMIFFIYTISTALQLILVSKPDSDIIQ